MISFLMLLMFLIFVFWYRLCDKRLTSKQVNKPWMRQSSKQRIKQRRCPKKFQNLVLVAARTC